MPSLGFGLEKAGLPSLKYPKMSLFVILLLSLLAGLGLLRLKPSGGLGELFRSSSPEFARYEELTQLFPTTEYDVMMLVQAKNLFTPEKLDNVRNVFLEMAFAEGVETTLSMFSIRGKPDKTGYAPPLFPADMPTGEAFEKLVKTVRDHPQIRNKFLSRPDKEGNQLVLMVLSLREGTTRAGVLEDVIDNIRKIADEETKAAGVSYMLTGAPVMQMEIRRAIAHDRITFNVIGFTFGVLISLFFLRRPTLVFISSICPAFAVLWIMGILGWVGQPISTFINVLPPLIMVITLSDSMHMVFGILRDLRAGKSRYEAVRDAILHVGPACVLTSLTTTVALFSMAFTDSADIRSFGLAAAGGTLMAFFAVITLVPTLTMLLIRDEADFLAKEGEGFNPLLWLEGICLKLAGFIVPRWRSIALVGVLVGAVFTGFHTQLEARYRLSDQLPDTDRTQRAMNLIDEKLSGAQTVNVLLKWPPELSFASARVVAAIGETHRMLAAQKQINHVTSLETIRLYLKDAHEKESLTFFGNYVNKLPNGLKQRYVNEKAHTALISGQIKNLEAARIAPIVRGLEPELTALRQKYPDFEFTPAGLAVVSALQSSSMIKQLNLGLMGAIIVVIMLLGVAFRSLDAALLSIVPNLFPIVAVGAFLYLTGEGLQFASVMALTVAFGLAVDDTIHFLNRYELEQRKKGDAQSCVRETMVHIGPVLVLTTLVLLCGLSVTSLSALPVTRLFGQLSMATLVAALVADMLILPAILLAARKYRPFGHDFALGKKKEDAVK